MAAGGGDEPPGWVDDPAAILDGLPLEDGAYRAKYGEYAASLGMSKEFLASYRTRLKIGIDKVWTKPTGD
jgi:hypothetical protein